MKKKITHPDGTVEEIEGTAEELAEFEKKNQPRPVKESKKQKQILLDDIRRVVQEEVAKQAKSCYHTYYYPNYPNQWQYYNPWWGLVQPNGLQPLNVPANQPVTIISSGRVPSGSQPVSIPTVFDVTIDGAPVQGAAGNPLSQITMNSGSFHWFPNVNAAAGCGVNWGWDNGHGCPTNPLNGKTIEVGALPPEYYGPQSNS